MGRIFLLLLISLPLIAYSQNQNETVCYNNATPTSRQSSEIGILTHFGEGCLSSDVSVLQSDSQGLLNYGFNNRFSKGNTLVEDFSLDTEEFLSSVTFYAFKDDPRTDPVVDAVRIRIWDGAPTLPDSKVIYGTLTLNRLLGATFTGNYRTNERTIPDCIRPIMEVRAEIGTSLPAGDYWLEWQFEVQNFIPPYRTPPITILGQSETGNAIQSSDNGISYEPITDKGNGAAQGLPFVLYCAAKEPVVSTIPTMGQWGLISLSLMLLIIGVVQVKEDYALVPQVESN